MKILATVVVWILLTACSTAHAEGSRTQEDMHMVAPAEQISMPQVIVGQP